MKRLVIIAFCFLMSSAHAGLITFDEFAADNSNGALDSNRYDYLGVTFVATDDGSTWGGMGNGDPGNWDLLGTNGSIFSGFNGSSHGLTMLFSSLIGQFSLDAARSAGSTSGDTFTLEGWLNGSLVESLTIVFADINSWTTVSLISMVDEVRWYGSGSGFHPYGVDNIQWNTNSVPAPASVALIGIGLIICRVFARRTSTSNL